MALNKVESSVGMFIAGALVGLTAGILCAPQSGARTRKQIRKRALRSMEQLDELSDDIRSQVDGWVEDVTDAVDEGLNRGRRMTLAGREKVLSLLVEAKQRVDEGCIRIERLMGGSDAEG